MLIALNLKLRTTQIQLKRYPINQLIRNSDICFNIDAGDNEGRLGTRPHHKRVDFKFLIVNFPLICSNIPAASECLVSLSVDTIFQSLWFLSGFHDRHHNIVIDHHVYTSILFIVFIIFPLLRQII